MICHEPGHAYEYVQRKLTEQEKTALLESLAAHGLRDPITLDQHGDILDGYNREVLCRKLGIEARYRVLEVDEPVHWIRHNQTARRNLSEAEMRDLIMETKARNPEASTRSIAEKLGVNHTTVSRTLSKSGVAPATPVKGKDGKTYKAKPKPKTERAAPEIEKALHAYDRRKAAGESLNKEDIAKEIGTSITPVRFAIAKRKAEEGVGEQAEIILSATAQEKFDAKLRAAQKQMALEYETAVNNAARKHVEEYSLPSYFKRLKEVEDLLNSPRWSVMPLTHFKMILACLHPDNARQGHEKRFEEAFTLFNNYKPKVVDLSREKEEKDRLKRIDARGNPLPSTVEELLARRKVKR